MHALPGRQTGGRVSSAGNRAELFLTQLNVDGFSRFDFRRRVVFFLFLRLHVLPLSLGFWLLPDFLNRRKQQANEDADDRNHNQVCRHMNLLYL